MLHLTPIYSTRAYSIIPSTHRSYKCMYIYIYINARSPTRYPSNQPTNRPKKSQKKERRKSNDALVRLETDISAPDRYIYKCIFSTAKCKCASRPVSQRQPPSTPASPPPSPPPFLKMQQYHSRPTSVPPKTDQKRKRKKRKCRTGDATPYPM